MKALKCKHDVEPSLHYVCEQATKGKDLKRSKLIYE